MNSINPTAKHRTGKAIITEAAAEVLDLDEIFVALGRHEQGDWGDMPEEDIRANDHALELGGGFHSCHTTKDGSRFWIIAESDRSVTTILLPDDY
jgi:hypothetical protein